MRNIIRLVASVGHRADLDYLIAMVGGELTVGHSYLTGPAIHLARSAWIT